jgi:Zn-dependent peptidase ImmA (M78 family)
MNKEAFIFSLVWATSKGKPHWLTTAALTVTIGGKAIWPVEGAAQISVDIQADDLLSHLTEFWKPLILRQTYPFGPQPERPSLLRSEMERRWLDQPALVAERENDVVAAFEEAHDLSRCFAGQFDLPPLWLVREADRMSVETRAALRTVRFDAARDALVQVGDEIAARLDASSDERWSDLIGAWRDRDKGDPAVLLAWSASLDRETARTFADEGVLSAPKSVHEAANDNDELRIAARMASALPSEQIRQIIGLASGFAKRAAPKLDEIAARTAEHIARHFAGHRPYEQGEAAASFVREQLDLASLQFVDIFDLVEALGVSLHPQAVQPGALFALAVWGDRHGPAVLLNESGLKLSKGGIPRNWKARVTLAHELCHLLLDRGHALSAVEILNSRMPLDIERRAKAFAGEFLLPGRVAAEIWFRSKNPRSTDGLDALLRSLCLRYGVTKNVAAWKLEHGLYRQGIDLRTLLDAVAPHR